MIWRGRSHRHTHSAHIVDADNRPLLMVGRPAAVVCKVSIDRMETSELVSSAGWTETCISASVMIVFRWRCWRRHFSQLLYMKKIHRDFNSVAQAPLGKQNQIVAKDSIIRNLMGKFLANLLQLSPSEIWCCFVQIGPFDGIEIEICFDFTKSCKWKNRKNIN